MNIKQLFLTVNPMSRPGYDLKKVKKIVIHYVGNPNTSALANRNYFENLKKQKKVYSSAHYIVGLEGEIIQCVPTDEIAYHSTKANGYSIGIENCHPKSDGKFTLATIKSLKELCLNLCIKYKLNPKTDIIRHYDVTGKRCPRYWVTHPKDFEQFKQDIYNFMYPPKPKPIVKIKVGDKVKIIGKKYATGQKIPLWVRLKKYEVIETTKDKVLLGKIISWCWRKDVKKV